MHKSRITTRLVCILARVQSPVQKFPLFPFLDAFFFFLGALLILAFLLSSLGRASLLSSLAPGTNTACALPLGGLDGSSLALRAAAVEVEVRSLTVPAIALALL